MTSLYSKAHIAEEQDRLYKIEDYSRGFLFFSDAITDMVNENQFDGIIDYGAGLAVLASILKFDFEINYFPYDPAIPEFSKRPQPKPLTLAINCLEYCEPQYLDNVITDLSSLTQEHCFIAVNTRCPGEVPPTIIQTNDWWIKKLGNSFDFSYLRQVGNGFIVIGMPLSNNNQAINSHSGIINEEFNHQRVKSAT